MPDGRVRTKMTSRYSPCRCGKKGRYKPVDPRFALWHGPDATICRYCKKIEGSKRAKPKAKPEPPKKSSVEKFYALRRPCDNCPFRTDIQPYLRKDRALEIVQHLERGSFSCHKTVDYSNEDEDGEDRTGHKPGPTEQQCAGAMIMQEKAGGLGQMGRIAERLGLYDHTKLDMDAPVFDNPAQFILAQEGDSREEFDSCSVCGPGCEAPAGYMGPSGPVATPNYTELPQCYICGEAVCETCSREHPDEEGQILCDDCHEQEYGDEDDDEG